MAEKFPREKPDQERLARLGDQGQAWRFESKRPAFKLPEQLMEPPLELTVSQLRGLRMVDETVVVVDRLNADGGEA